MSRVRSIDRPRDEQGSIAVFIAVMMVATSLVFATMLVVENGLRTSRRAGDSANALQVADAGVNDAIKAIPTVAGTSFTRSGTVGNGSFNYTVTQDAVLPAIWHIDAVGTDATGVKRHLRADAKGEPLFASPMYINNSLDASSGTILDSYRSGASLIGPSGDYSDGGCTDKGIMYFSPTATISFSTSGSGSSIVNCNQLRFNNSWKFAMDGCVVYGSGPPPPASAQGPPKCPDGSYPGRTKSISQIFNVPVIKAPSPADVTLPVQAPGSTTATPGTTFTCAVSTGPTATVGGNTTGPLRAGSLYYFSQVTLKDGCGVDPSTILTGAAADPAWVAANPARIFANTVTVASGTHGRVNPPPSKTTFPNICGTGVDTSTWTYQDINNNAARDYCSGWVKSLAVNVIDGGSPTVSVTGNGGNFWGTFAAPAAPVTLNSPNMEFWGAMLAGSLKAKSQFSWHYDDSLSDIVTGKYVTSSWREEPL